MKTKKVLITGAAGFLGSHLCDRFIKEGFQVMGMDNLITGDLKNIEHLFAKQNEKSLVLALHPYVQAFFTKGLISQRVKWFFKYKRWVNLIVDSSMAITEFKFLNKEGEEIQLNA